MTTTPRPTRRILTRPTAGTNRNAIRPYWIIDNNIRKEPGRHAASGLGKGLYIVTPAWRGSILYGTVSRYSVSNIVFSSGWSEYWPFDPGFTATLSIGPPTAPEEPRRQAVASPQFGTFDPYNEDWYRLNSVILTDGGEGYVSPPTVHINYVPTPHPNLQFNIRAEIGANGITLDSSDHGLKVGDIVSYRWAVKDEDFIRNNPPIPYAMFGRRVDAVSGAVIHLGGGYPQPGLDPEGENDYYAPGDLCDGHSASNFKWGTSAVGPKWSEPISWDAHKYDPYANAPPYRVSIFKHDPDPVHFYQDTHGGPLRIGDLVAVHETVRLDGQHRSCWPVGGTGRYPWWGIT